MSDNIVQLNTELFHSELKDLVRNPVEETLNALLDAEADRLVNNPRHMETEYFDDIITVFGHTPTLYLSGEYCGKGIKTRTWIDIDTGCPK